jgi:DNA end-binding protein Ku
LAGGSSWDLVHMAPRRKNGTSLPRSLWTGSIAFGLVNVPVRLYPAVREHTLHFHYVHADDNSPIGYQKICKAEQKPVPDDEIVKAFEYDKGEYVFMSDDDFESAQAEKTKSIDVTDFVPAEEIDPIFFAKTYYAGPGEGAERVYSLLVKALEESELVGVGKLVLRDRQRLVALRVRDGVIAVEQMHFADEIVKVAEIKPKAQRVGKEELALARQLIESATGDWNPTRYKDTYRDELRAAIEAKRKARKTHQAAEVEEETEQTAGAPDLLEALRASLEQSKGRSRRSSRARSSRTGRSRSRARAA